MWIFVWNLAHREQNGTDWTCRNSITVLIFLEFTLELRRSLVFVIDYFFVFSSAGTRGHCQFMLMRCARSFRMLSLPHQPESCQLKTKGEVFHKLITDSQAPKRFQTHIRPTFAINIVSFAFVRGITRLSYRWCRPIEPVITSSTKWWEYWEYVSDASKTEQEIFADFRPEAYSEANSAVGTFFDEAKLRIERKYHHLTNESIRRFINGVVAYLSFLQEDLVTEYLSLVYTSNVLNDKSVVILEK